MFYSQQVISMQNRNYPKRKSPRLEGYDYSTTNAYLVTICSHNHNIVFGNVIHGDELTPSICKLTKYGMIAEQELLNLTHRYPYISIDNYIIMPNHIHILLSLHETDYPRPSISDIICTFKSLTTRKCRQAGFPKTPLFQGSFHDEIIRSESHYLNTWHYIDINPIKWSLDKYYKER